MNTLPSVTCQRANASHILGFLALQERNLLIHVPESKQAGGFVTTPFTEAQLQEILVKEDVFVALHEGEVMGYVVCASWSYLSQYLIFAFMMKLLPSVTAFEEAVTERNSYQYGPVCVAEAWRGKGVFEQLFAYARAQMQAKYPYALTFVNKRNRRSFEAHTRKLGLRPLQEFSFSGQHFHMFGFTTDASRIGAWQKAEHSIKEMA
jgi:GNAT superfamily N-acetyltransferase